MKCMKLLAILFLLTAGLMAAEKPNVIFIYGDDVGYGDVGVYGSTMIPTPHIDKLANSGIRFTDGHCSAATCSPSRFSMLTGLHGFRNDVGILPPDAPMAIPENIFTLPDMFKKAGYNTAVIGKWHLGIGAKGVKTNWNGDVKPGPLELGFDYSFLLPSTNDRVPCVYLENYRVVNHDPNDPIFVKRKFDSTGVDPRSTVYPDGKKDRAAMTYYPSSHGHNNSVINGIGRMGYMWGGKKALWDDEKMADEFINKTRDYLKRQKEAGKPFFLYYASQDIHVPRTPHPRFIGKTKLGYRGDAMVQFDWQVGAIVNSLKKLGLYENTIIMLSSDNGPVYDDGYKDGTTVRTSTKDSDRGHDGSGPYRGGKYRILEGGTRVPFLMSWPAKIKAGQVSDSMVSQLDLMASFASYLKVDIGDAARDSRNIWPALTNKDQDSYEVMITESPIDLGIRKGNWKFSMPKPGKKSWVKSEGLKLFNLNNDKEEKKNLAKQHPELVKELRTKLIEVYKKQQAVNGYLN